MNHTSKKLKKLLLFASILLVGAFLATFALRGYRAVDTAVGARNQVKMLIQTGGTIGESPASKTFSTSYLQAIFGDNPQLLNELQSVIQSGISDTPALSLGEVSAMLVTYHQNGDNEVKDVVAHVIGGFPLNQRKPGFHQNGFFYNMVDKPVWSAGNQMVGMLGRDMALFAREETLEKHRESLEGMLNGDIMPLVSSLSTPLHYTMVMPNPKNLIPRQLSRHVQAIIVKGWMSRKGGENRTIVLTPSPQAANYCLLVLSDMKRAAEITLRTKFKGIVQQREWGPQIDPWWAYEMVQTSMDSTVEKDGNIIRFETDYERKMLNAVLKSMERMGRDLAQSRMSLSEKMSPVEVDRKMQSRKPNHYWTDRHRWGPNWPIPPGSNEVAEVRQAQDAQKAQPSNPSPPAATAEEPSA